MIGSLMCRWNLHHAYRASTAEDGQRYRSCHRCGRHAGRGDARPVEESAQLRNRVTARVWNEVGPQP